MKLEVVSIHNHGNASQEYVTLRALDDANLIKYLITDTTFLGANAISNKLRHVHWFVFQQVKKGDFVRLYTSRGTNKSLANHAGTTTYDVYWGLSSSVWNDTGDAAVLFEVENWKTTKVS